MTARRRAKPDPASEPTEEEKAFRVEFGRRMRVLRVARGLSQEELAQRTDMSRAFLGAVESGKHGLQVFRLLRLARALDVPPQVFRLLRLARAFNVPPQVFLDPDLTAARIALGAAHTLGLLLVGADPLGWPGRVTGDAQRSVRTLDAARPAVRDNPRRQGAGPTRTDNQKDHLCDEKNETRGECY